MAGITRNYDDIYLPELNRIVDDLFQKAADQRWTWATLAEESGLAYKTVKNLGNRVTRYPELRTVQLIADSLGVSITFSRNPRHRTITWTPQIFDGRGAA